MEEFDDEIFGKEVFCVSNNGAESVGASQRSRFCEVGETSCLDHKLKDGSIVCVVN